MRDEKPTHNNNYYYTYVHALHTLSLLTFTHSYMYVCMCSSVVTDGFMVFWSDGERKKGCNKEGEWGLGTISNSTQIYYST